MDVAKDIKGLTNDIRTAFGGAAMALATKDAAENNEELTTKKVNSWSLKLNVVAGWLIAVYVGTIFIAGHTVGNIEQENMERLYARMTPQEIADYKDRINTGRNGPLKPKTEADKCQDSKANKVK